MKLLDANAIGRSVGRTEGREKVTGAATYSAEYAIEDAVYAWLVQAVIARGRVTSVDASAALALDGTLHVLTHSDVPSLTEADDAELLVLQSDEVHYRGQIVAIVVARSLEAAREAAGLVRVEYAPEPHHVVLRTDDPRLYAPEKVNPDFPTDTEAGSIDQAMSGAAFTVDAEYRTPGLHNNPMEPHASIARWTDGRLEVWDSNQAPAAVAGTLATVFGIEPDQVHVITHHVGGGFGSKGSARPNVVAAALAAKVIGRPVKLTLTRQAMFSLVGYRTPTIQHLRLAADENGRLTGIGHEIVEQTSQVLEFAEQTGEPTRHMYAAPNRLVTHRLAALDVPSPRWMRAPGECPGMFALESAMDELALVAGIDPVELRIRNEPDLDPTTGDPFSSRHYVECLRDGAARFGWEGPDRAVGRRDGHWLIGTGMAGSTYPVNLLPASARVHVDSTGRYTVSIAAADIGQGGRTVLRQIAADALGVDLDRVTVELGDSTLPTASVAGGSSGTSSWGWAVTKASQALRAQIRDGVPTGGLQATADISDEMAAQPSRSRHAFGAQFVEVRVNADTGEVRVSRALGVFAAGRIVNPQLARSQFIGGMTMGLSMALQEEGLMDPLFGDYANHDLAEYHLAVHADIPAIEVHWLDEFDDDLTPVGGKGIGEIGIVGTAAAVISAVANATGHRVRDLPVRPDKLLAATTRFSRGGR
ncbi:MAG: molybdopterin binding aldehyde oxidase and xanthine dehydrogenase protein [Pseudonocardiales bacterium]|nr:molybdopterin binding aldehyde oxidase and xanthine dehydrogenase protein [Pseudonocardiales bacterium]